MNKKKIVEYVSLIALFTVPLLLLGLSLFTELWEIISSPLKDFNALWTLVPVYINWLLNEVFFEKQRGDFRTMFSNGFTALWVGVNWLRYLVEGNLESIRIIITSLMIIYSLSIMVWAAKGKLIAKMLGRIRLFSFAAIVLTPFIYNTLVITTSTLLASLTLFAVFWLVFNALSRLVPEVPGEKKED